MISDIIHFNRDENSFTARFFERLIPKFEKSNEEFNHFLSIIQKTAVYNKGQLKNNNLQPPSFSKMKYLDSMPFLENIDLYSYCKNNDIQIEIDEESVDKTEFDYVITAEDESREQIIIVFEVKCFSDLREEEIVRQNKLLEEYKKVRLFDEYFHIALISHENFINGRVPQNSFQNANCFSIITWDDIKEFIDSKRIKNEIELSQLKKVIHKKNGKGETDRFLIKRKRSS